MKTKCPHAQSPLVSSKVQVGQTARCPRCQRIFQVQPAIQPDTRNCDSCSESILANAKRCKHCGEVLDPALRAAEEAKELARRNGGASAAASTTVVIGGGQGRSFAWWHTIRLVLTVLTCGLWAPIWALHFFL